MRLKMTALSLIVITAQAASVAAQPSPDSVPGAMSGPPGIWIPPGIGLGVASTAIAAPGRTSAMATARPTTNGILERALIGSPFPPRRSEAEDGPTASAPAPPMSIRFGIPRYRGMHRLPKQWPRNKR